MNYSEISNAANDKFILVRGCEVFKSSPSSPLFFASEQIARAFVKDGCAGFNAKAFRPVEIGSEKANRAMMASFGCKKPKVKKGTNLKRFTDGMEKLGLHVTFA